MRVFILLFCLCGTIYAFSNFPLGANLAELQDYSTDVVFVDQVMASRKFGKPNAPWDTTNMTYDANGWPTGDFGVILLGGNFILPETYGNWYLTWKGNATCYSVASKVTVFNQTYNATTNQGVAYVFMPNDGTNFMLGFNTKGKGVTGLKAIRPGYDINNPPIFTKSILSALKGLNTFRFMDWARTNNNLNSKWSDRSSPITAQQLTGIPWEYAILISNTLKTNMWVNIPHMADDNYVLQLATLIKSQLDPSLHVYVEYSNEVWNGQFVQYHYNYDQALQMVNNGTYGPIFNYDGVNSTYYWAFRRYGWRAMGISNIFRQVWGDCAMNDRVRVIYAGQIANPTVMESGLDMIDAIYGPPSYFFYAAAGAPYFSLGSAGNNNSLTADDVIYYLNKTSLSFDYTENVAFSTFYGLKFFCYEAGSDTFGPTSIAAKKAGSLDPRMKGIVVQYLNAWYASGGGLLNWFNFFSTNYDSQYGTWGITHAMNVTDSPKLQGVQQVVASPLPQVTAGKAIPGIISAGARAKYPDSSGYWRYMDYGARAFYFLNDQHTYGAVYNVYFNYTSGPNSTVDVRLNNQLVYNLTLFKSPGYTISEPINITVLSGINTLLLTSTMHVHGPFSLSSIIFEVAEELTSAPVVPNNCTVNTTGGSTTGSTTESTTGSEVSRAVLVEMSVFGLLVLFILAL